MAIKAGAILHDANGYVIDRIQTAGPGALNIPQEKIYELGNWNTVATVYDIPDLSFDLESYDVTTEFEAILTNKVPSSVNNGDAIDFANHVPIDIISPFKSRRNAYDIVKGLATPYLTLERATYRFGLRQNAMQMFTLRGDSIYYIPGQPYYEEFTFDGTQISSGTGYTLAHTPIAYAEGSDTLYAYCVVLVNSTNGDYKRLYHIPAASSSTAGYKDNSSGKVWIPDGAALYSTYGYDTCRVVYGSLATVDYDPDPNNTGLNPSGNKVHENVSVKPAAVRPRDINVYVGTGATPEANWQRLTGVQSVEMSWAVQLDNDEEFGNKHYVMQDYDVPDVTGSVGIKAFDVNDLWAKIALITGLTTDDVIGPNVTIPIPIKAEIADPSTGSILKTIYCPDARFQVPGLAGRVQQKLEVTMNFTSDQGILKVYKGQKA